MKTERENYASKNGLGLATLSKVSGLSLSLLSERLLSERLLSQRAPGMEIGFDLQFARGDSEPQHGKNSY